MVKHPRRCAALLSLLAVAVAAPPASAVNLGEWVPGLKISPFITERAEYDTNVFRQRINTNDALGMRTVPGFVLDYEAAPLLLSTGYRAEFLEWIGLKGNQNDTHHIAFLNSRLELSRLTTSLSENFVRTSDPPASSDVVGRIESVTNTLVPDMEYKLTPRLSFGANGGWTHVNFISRSLEALDRNEYRAGSALFWKIVPKADVSLQYAYLTTRYIHAPDQINDAHQNQVLVGLRGEVTPKISSSLRGGYTIRTFDKANVPTTGTYTFGGDLAYRITGATKLSLFADRSYQPSTFGAGVGKGYFVGTTVTLLGEHQFTPKLTGSVNVSGSANDYGSKELDAVHGTLRFRHDTLWGWGGTMEYAIQKWLQVGAEYSHIIRSSNFLDNNYKDDRVVGKLTLTF